MDDEYYDKFFLGVRRLINNLYGLIVIGVIADIS
jgi:hypothetical protein